MCMFSLFTVNADSGKETCLFPIQNVLGIVNIEQSRQTASHSKRSFLFPELISSEFSMMPNFLLKFTEDGRRCEQLRGNSSLNQQLDIPKTANTIKYVTHA